MRSLAAFLFISTLSTFAQAHSESCVDTFKTDYFCNFVDPAGFHDDEGYKVTVYYNADVDVRFVENAREKYRLDCSLDIFATNPTDLVIQCGFPQDPRLSMTWTMNKQTLAARVQITGETEASYEMTCRADH